MMIDENSIEEDKIDTPSFSWVETHKEIVKWLQTKENDQEAIIALLKDIGVNGLTDKNSDGTKIDLDEIDPFTFFRYIYKHKNYKDQSSTKSLESLQKIAKKINITIPYDAFGIPTTNALKVCLFPFKPDRTNNKIARLWKLFYSAINNTITDEQFADSLEITDTRIKLTEVLFYVNPERYFPIDNPTKQYLKEELGINHKSSSYTEYMEILEQIKAKTNMPFYESSYKAWKWNEDRRDPTGSFYESLLKRFDKKEIDEYFSLIRKIIVHCDLKKDDERLWFRLYKKIGGIYFVAGNNFSIYLAASDYNGKYVKKRAVIISNNKISNEGYPINNENRFHNDYESLNLSEKEKELVFKAVATELDIAKNRSAYRQKSNNEEFENYAFGIQPPPGSPMNINTILYGPPGTGKTYNTILRAAEIIEDRKIDNYDKALEIFNANLHDRIEFITFHQNYSYEDFIQGLRPDVENNNELTFERKDGIFKVIADKALRNLKESEKPETIKKPFEEIFNQFIDPLVEGEIEEIEMKMKQTSYFITAITNKSIDFRKTNGSTAHTLSIATLKKMYEEESTLNIQGLSSYYSPLLRELLAIGKDSSGITGSAPKQNYVLIIDEINRANISRVFGELITLIEPDKRYGGKIPMEAKLPSGDTFIVPSNLYIVGTMNTADKSIALLDIALRRRFEFESMYPKYKIDDHEIYDVEVLKKLNKQIIESKGHDFQIGHSYFMGDNKELVPRMNKKVIPLLMEYYMNDAKEVGKILTNAGLELEPDSWPIEITGKKK